MSSFVLMQGLTRSRLTPGRVMIVLGAASFVYLGTAYAVFHGSRIYYAPPAPENIADPRFQARDNPLSAKTYSALSNDYDSKIGWDEWIMGMGILRSKLADRVRGKVLEVAAGTGRNLSHYPAFDKKDTTRFSSLTISDANPQMLEKAYQKFQESYGKRLPPTAFTLADSEKLPFETSSFDTVVSSFGLCSVPDPEASVKEMARVCKKDPESRVILLEHGRRRENDLWGEKLHWLNIALDKTARAHATDWGCWWNRDILEFVERSGLEVLEVKRYHLGTTYLIEARPKQ